MRLSGETDTARVGASHVRKACWGRAARASSRICDQTSAALSSSEITKNRRGTTPADGGAKLGVGCGKVKRVWSPGDRIARPSSGRRNSPEIGPPGEGRVEAV